MKGLFCQVKENLYEECMKFFKNGNKQIILNMRKHAGIGICALKKNAFAFYIWWRRWDSNPRPKRININLYVRRYQFSRLIQESITTLKSARVFFPEILNL